MSPSTKISIREELDRLVRRQRSIIVSNLLRQFGAMHLDLIEDATQDALVAALENWAFKGLPDNPTAWIRRVAHNRIIDKLRQVKPKVELDWLTTESRYDDTDSELRLLLLCCQSAINQLDQQLLMLNLVVGLTHKEIANLTLSKTDRISQRLARAKTKLKSSAVAEPLLEATLVSTVSQIIYSSFSLGYFPRQGERLIRRDVALEALRLATVLAEKLAKHHDQLGETNALCALLSFQASRLDARQDADGNAILLAEQDTDKWDKQLIKRGNEFLLLARQSSSPTPIHIEAAIAAIHANTKQPDWQVISELYTALLKLKTSPGIQLSAALAKAYCGEAEEALKLLARLDEVQGYSPMYVAKAEILKTLGKKKEAQEAYQQALDTESSLPIHQLIEKRLAIL